MNRIKTENKVFDRDTLLTIMALSGEFPLDGLVRLGVSEGYSRVIKHRLMDDKDVEFILENKLKGLVLTQKEKNRLIKSNPKRYAMVNTQNTRGQTRRARSHLFARTYCSLLNADIEFLNDKKPYIYAREHNGNDKELRYPLLRTKLLNTEPMFFDSKDIKYSLGDHVQQIRNSAMMGLILTREDCWALYNMDSNKYPLGYATERKVSILLCDGRILDQHQELQSKAIFLVSDFDAAADLILGNKSKDIKPSRIISDSPFSSIYMIPENHYGDIALKTLCHKNINEMVWNVFRNNFGTRVSGFAMENDAVYEGMPVCNLCNLDIVKLIHFKQSLLINKTTGLIACFDFQEEFLARIMKPAKVTFKRIYMNEFEEVLQNVTG